MKEQSRDARPNLVFIYTEGQRADALGLAGNTILKTPNQDRIGREGVRFTNAFCTNALCAPARAAALTGMYSRATGALGNTDVDRLLPANIPLFTDLLREAGYEIAILGKIHVKNGVMERYWDYYFGFNAPVTNYYHPRFREGRQGKVGEAVTYGKFADDLVTDRALAWLAEEHAKPFCLLLWYQTPHAPFYRPRRLLDLYNGVSIPKPLTFDDDLKGYPGKPRAFVEATNKIGTTVMDDAVRSLEELVKDYYAGLVAVDENIGRVLDWLERAGKLEDTAIVHSSDHGFFLGEWRLFDKRLMHEPSIRIPMLLRYPKRIKGGLTRDEMVLDIDIAPTLLDLAGVRIPDHMHGRSIMGLTTGDAVNWRKDWLYEYYQYPGGEQVRPHRGVRSDRHKLIHYYLDPQEYEMYDLEIDPGETHNAYGDPKYEHIQSQLWKRLDELQREIRTIDSAG